MAITQQTDIRAQVRARLAQRGISGAQADQVMSKLDERLAKRHAPAPSAQPDPYAKYQVQPDALSLGDGINNAARPNAFADPQIDPNNYGSEIEQAAKSITPQEIADLRAYAKASGGNLEGQQDSDVALVAARMKLQPGGVMQRRGPSVSPVRGSGVAATSPLGEMARAIPGVKQARDFAYGAAQGGISQPGSGIASVLGTVSGLAGFDNAASIFHEAADQINTQAPQGTGVPFKLGTVAGQVAPAVSAAATGGATTPLVMGLLSTASFGSGVQEYRNTLLSRGEKPTPGGELAVGLAFAGVEWITERVGLDAAMRKIPGLSDSLRAFRTSPTPAAAMKLVDELAPVMLSNAGEEISAQGGQNLIAKLKYDPNRDLTAGMGEAGLLGAAGGAMIAAPGAALNSLGAGFNAYDARRRAQQQPPQAPDNQTTPPDNRGQAPDTTALDEAAAQAEARLNEQFNRAAPVGTPSPADQSASSQTEQDAGANEMYDQAIDAIMQQRAERRAARQDTSVYDEALANILAQRNARRAERAITETTPATPSTPTSERPASGPQAVGRTATGTAPDAGTSPSPVLPGAQRPASSGPTASQTGLVVGGGTSASPQSTREPWQMTRVEWVGGGTVGRIRFGDVDREVVESPQFDTPEEAKAWASSRGIANPQIQSSGKRGGPKLYKASGSTSVHRDAVESAHAAGKPVPPEVLAEYGIKPNPSESPKSSNPPAKTDSSREPWQMTRGEFRDWSYTNEYREARAAAEQADKAAENAVTEMEREVGVSSRSSMQGLGGVDGVSPKAFGLVQAADAMRQQKEFDAALEAMPEQFKKKHADAVAKWERAHARARSFEDFDTAQEMMKEYGLSNPPAKPDSSTQPQGGAAANPNQENANGEEEAPQAEVLKDGAPAPAKGAGSAEDTTSPDKPIPVDAAVAMTDQQIRKRIMDLVELVGGKPASEMGVLVTVEIGRAKVHVHDNGPNMRPTEYQTDLPSATVTLQEDPRNDNALAKKIDQRLDDKGMRFRSGFKWYGTDGRSIGQFILVSDSDYSDVAARTVATTKPTYKPPQPAPAKVEGKGKAQADAATIPQEQTDGTGGSSTGSVGAARVNGQSAREGQQAEDAGRAPKPQPAKAGKTRAFSRADIERRIGKILSDLQLDRSAEFEDYASEERDNNSLGSTFSTSFGGDIPADIKAWIDGNKFFAKYFKTNQRNATGEDALARLGLDKYIERVLEQFQPSKIARERSKMLRGHSPEANMLLWLLDRLEGGTSGRAKWKTVQASTLKDGQTFAIDGVNFEVMPNEDEQLTVTQRGPNGEPIDNAQVWELAALTDIPVDENTLGMRDDTGEVPDIAPEVKPAPAPAAREPWQMTRAEWQTSQNTPIVDAVRKSIQDGKPVSVRTQRRITPLGSADQIRLTPKGDIQTREGSSWVTLTIDQAEDIARQAGLAVPPIEHRVYHKSEVQDARDAGKPVPTEVLAEYGLEAAPEAPKPKPAMWRVGDKFTFKKGYSKWFEGRWTVTDVEDIGADRGVQMVGIQKDGSDRHNAFTSEKLRDEYDIRPPEEAERRERELKDMPTHMAQLRYPGIRSGETVAEYEKRMAAPEVKPAPESDDADAMLGRIKEQLGRGSGRQSPDMIRAFQELGTTLVPGVRLQDAEEVGRMYAMLDDGTATLAEYTAYIEDLRKSGKVAKTAPESKPAPAKFSDSEGVFGQKTESITGSQTSMFGDTRAETPDLSQYPSIRSGETIDAYKKRMGITDTPDMFGGGTGGASPGAAFRNAPTINDRAAAALMDWSNRARKRFDDYMGKMQRGEILGSGPPITPLIDLAAHVAFKALASGITSKSGRKLTAFVEGRMADIRAKWPSLNVTTATLRRQVRAMLAAANDDREKIIPAYAAARERVERQRTKQTGKESGKPAEVREAVASATAERPDVAAKIIDAVKRGLRQGRAEGLRTASDAIKPLIRQARDAAKRARQVADIEARGASEKATNAAKDQAATEKGIRAEAVRLVQETPIAGRRKYLTAVANAANMRDLAKILRRLRGDLAKETGRHFALRAERLEDSFKKLDEKRLNPARKLLRDIRQMYAELKDKDTGVDQREELADSIRDSFETLNSIIHEQRAADKVFMQGRAIVLAEHRDKMMEAVQKQAELPKPENSKDDREPTWLRQKIRKYADFRTLMQILDRVWDETGIFSRARRAMESRRTAELAKNHEFIDKAEKIVQANGYKSWSDFMARSEGAMGDSGAEWVKIDLGAVDRLTVGQAMSLYAQDIETKELMHAGQPWRLNRSGDQFVIDDYKLAELESKLTAGQKRIARQINALRSEMQFDRADAVYKRITGNHMTKVDGHYPRKRILDKSGSEDTIDIAKLSMGEWAVQSLENSGFTIKRVQDRKTPLLLEDFGSTQVRSFQGTEMMIQRAEMVKYLKATLFNPAISDAIAQRYGGAMMKRITQVVAEYSGNSAPESDKFIRKVAAGTARSMTQVNPGTWLRNLSTVFRLPLAMIDGKMVGAGAVAAAIPKALLNWRSTLKILMQHSPDLRHRWSHAGAAISMMPTGATTDVDSHFADATKATVRQVLHAARAWSSPRTSGGRLRQVGKGWGQILDSIKVGNAFDAFAAVVAYHIARPKASESLSPGAADKWAARKAADAFMQTANTNDLLNANEWQTDAKRNTGAALILTFTSDIAKMQNLLFLANKRGGKARTLAAGAVAASLVWSVAVRYALASLLGDDDEKKDQEAINTVREELVSLIPGGTNLWNPLLDTMTRGGRTRLSVLDTPLTSIVRHGEALVNEMRKEDGDPLEMAYRASRVFLDPVGNPLAPISGMARRAFKNYAE